MHALEVALRQPWIARLGWALVHFLWQGTVIAAAYAAVRATGGRRLSARGRYGLACAALAILTAAPPITFLVASGAGARAAASAAVWPAAGGAAWERALPWLVVAWAAGASLFSVRLIGGWRMVSRLTRVAVCAPPREWREALDALASRMRVSAPVRLLVSSLASTPTVVGWLRPVILVPVEALTGMPAEQMQGLLAHELAHILRRDYLVNILQSLAEAVLFYHPAVWWISAQIRAEREACCDDLAVEATGDLLTYANALANLESQRKTRLRLATAADGGSLVTRIRRLLGQAERTSDALPNPAAVCVLSLLWLAGMGAVLAHANPPTQTGHTMRLADVAPRAPAVAAVPPPARKSLTSALLFDPFFEAPRPEPPPQNDSKQLATVSGTVLSTSGIPIAEAAAVLYPLDKEPPATGPKPHEQIVTSDAAGKFTFDKVAPGTYRFSISHQLYQHPRSGDYGPQPPSRLTLTAGQVVDDIKVRLLEPATLTGRTVDEDGDPVSLANVQLIRRVYAEGQRRLDVVGYATSGDNGEFKIPGIQPGRYILKADKPPLWIPEPVYTGTYSNLRPSSSASERAPIPAAKPGAKIYNPATTYYGGSNTPAGATPIDVSPGQNIPLGAIKMENRAILHVRGKVVGDPALLAGARVSPLQTDGTSFTRPWNYGADIARDGSFDLANVQPGSTFTIGVINPKLEARILGWTRISVGQADLQAVVINASIGPMNGMLRFEEGGAPPDANSALVEIWLSAPAVFGLMTRVTKANTDGSFTIPNVPPGVYTVAARLPQGSYVKSVRLNGRDLPEQQIEWQGGASGAVELIASRKAAVIEGTLLDSDGKPAAGTVTLVPDSQRPAQFRWYPVASADAQGSFRFPAVAPGRYKLYAWEEIENTAHWDPDFIRPFESRGQSIEVQESGRSTVTARRISIPVMREVLVKAGIL